jgi:multimeric flavodoxin WrbA
MARKVVAFIGSPRKGGNTDVLISEMLSAADQNGAETEKVFLSDLDIKPCRACEACRKQTPTRCVMTGDDFDEVAEKMKAADALIFGTPVYWFSLTAQFKLFMDRWSGFLDKDYNSLLKDKSAAVVVCCGDTNTKPMTDPLLRIFRETFEALGLDLVGCITTSAHLKGEVAKNKDAMQKAADVGQKLANTLTPGRSARGHVQEVWMESEQE